MASILPILTLFTDNITLTPLAYWPVDEGPVYGEDQWWLGGPAPQPYQWTMTATITQQNHSSFSTPQLYIYDALDIQVGRIQENGCEVGWDLVFRLRPPSFSVLS